MSQNQFEQQELRHELQQKQKLQQQQETPMNNGLNNLSRPSGCNASSSSLASLLPGGVVTTQNISTVIKPKENNKSMQFVKITPPDLSKKAVEQIRVAQESKITKDKLKEVEEEWQSNLLKWKSKRRQHLVGPSGYGDSDEQNNNNAENGSSGRKVKTFAEIVEQRAKNGNRLNFNLQRYIGSGDEDEGVEEDDSVDNQPLPNENNNSFHQDFHINSTERDAVDATNNHTEDKPKIDSVDFISSNSHGRVEDVNVNETLDHSETEMQLTVEQQSIESLPKNSNNNNGNDHSIDDNNCNTNHQQQQPPPTPPPIPPPLPPPLPPSLPPPLPPQKHQKEDKDRTVLSVSGKRRCSSCKEELGRGAAAFVVESLNLVYHTNCFKCSVCHVDLSNGFRGVDVRVHAGALHCQNCYSKDGLNYSRV